MAYNNSPENSTYKTVELEFTSTSWPRDGEPGSSRDPLILNMYYDRNSNENQTRDFVLVKRPGLQASEIDLSKDATTDVINGYFQDTNTGKIYWSVNNKVWRYDGTTVDLIATMGGTTPTGLNSVGFCLFLRSTGSRYLMINNGTQLWYHLVTTSSATQVVDADYPSPTSPHMVFLDGYLFVVKADTGDIYNGDLDSVSSWTAGNYVTAEINPDFALTLAKVKNYLVCFGTTGVEFFYDAANPSGSPLARNESFYKSVALQSSVCNVGDVLYFVGRLANGGPQIFKLDGNSLNIISSSWVERQLVNAFGVTYGASSFLNLMLFQFSANGHNFIGINMDSSFFLVYDLNEGFWYKWSFGNDASVNQNRVELVVKTFSGTLDFIAIGNTDTFSILSTGTYTDFGEDFTVSYITEDIDLGTFNWKSCHRFALHCDYPTLFDTSAAQISWSDDDGQTWTSPRDLVVTTNNPYITQCGRFRTRNWNIEYTDSYPFRMWGLSMDINVGAI